MVQTLHRARQTLGLGSPNTLAQVGGFGFGELLLIALILFFFFGAKRLPEIGRGLGGGIRSFKAAMRGDTGPAEPPRQLPPDDPNTPPG